MDPRVTQPLTDAKEEAIVKRVASDLLAKPGFIRNAVTQDYLYRALRKVVLEITDYRNKEK